VSKRVSPASGDAAPLAIQLKNRKEVPLEELKTEIPIPIQ
jgi:hypothetical protein